MVASPFPTSGSIAFHCGGRCPPGRRSRSARPGRRSRPGPPSRRKRSPRAARPPGPPRPVISHAIACCSVVSTASASRMSVRACSRSRSRRARTCSMSPMRAARAAESPRTARRPPSESIVERIARRRSADRRAIAASRRTWASVRRSSPVRERKNSAPRPDGPPGPPCAWAGMANSDTANTAIAANARRIDSSVECFDVSIGMVTEFDVRRSRSLRTATTAAQPRGIAMAAPGRVPCAGVAARSRHARRSTPRTCR